MSSNKSVLASIAAALSGFLFGFDTVVISGANLPIKELWQTSDWFHGTFIMSMALWGTVVGALLAGIPTNKLGRKTTLVWIGVFYFVSALGSALAPDPYSFSLFRFIGGLGVGVSSIAAPTYISEISAAHNRGRLGILYQFNIVFGILIAYVSNYLLEGVGGEADWRYMLGIEALPALVYTVLVMRVPQSPRWLLRHRRDHEAALAAATRLTSNAAAAQEMVAAGTVSPEEASAKKASLFTAKYSKPLLLAFLIAFFNQASGINFILYYAPEILEKAGFGTSGSLFSSIVIGLINLIFTLLGMALIDKAGRKQLMYIGSFGYIVSLLMVAYGFYTGAAAEFKLVFILMFIASHAIGQGAVIWIFISEIFPNQVRAYGQAWGSGTHWVFAALITLTGSLLINSLEPWVAFAIFGGLMCLQLVFVHFMMPETKGRSLEDLEKELMG
ncbi:sugar porter family MFS transporter [Marinoscillum furvescens]|uniref:Sugar porter (SP) family MFS transporter n=1 Tax=Marinoscillum furvescens DSM 4134 TaxID=1122208 RepID=A0A3D9L5D0_MARFU|nr:sugar porter family MFS transporter [Marinoscillum furvescens]RED98427.1 sugar porter (SP) family MFS transporter [Marinoscillum furvescens DSM 4134]